MADPRINNRQPAPEATGMLLEDDYHLSLRDPDTKIDLTSLRAQVAYSRVNFTANLLLPEDDSSVTEHGNSFVAAFSDAAPTAVPAGVEAVRTLVAGLLDISRGVPGAHRGAQVISSSFSRGPHMMEVDLLPVAWTTGTETYISNVDYTGICAGFVHGPTKRGIFVFLLDDGFTKSLLISPPDDGSATRPGSATVAYDWTLGVVLKVVWDDELDTVDVYARDPADPAADSVKVFTASFSGLATFINGVALGPVPLGPTAPEVDELYCFLNLDSPTVADNLRSDFIRIFEHGKLLVNLGNPRAGVFLDIRPSDIVKADFLALPDKADLPWQSSLQGGDVVQVLTPDGVRLDKLEGVANGELLGYLVRDEPSLDFSEGLWLEVELLPSEVDHLTTESTGIGVQILDGADALVLAYMDNYATKSFGVLQAGAAFLATSYAAGAVVDWTIPTRVKLWANPDLDRVDLFVGDDDTPYATGLLSALPADLTSPQIRIGHINAYTGRPVFGKAELRALEYTLNARGYDTVEGVVPDLSALPWIRTSPGPGSDAVVGGELQLVDAGFGVPGQVRRFHRVITGLNPLLGLSVEARFSILSYTNEVGTLAALNTSIEVGPVLDDGTEVARLMFVSTAGGTFVYIPGSNPATSLLEVIDQSEEGQAISHPLDFSQVHTYRLEKKPRQHLRLLVDGVEVILIPEGEVSLPPTIIGPSVGFGSFGDQKATTSHWRRLVYAVGDGYDIAVRPSVPVDERHFLFDALSELVVQVDGI